jgi:hypothetical protein
MIKNVCHILFKQILLTQIGNKKFITLTLQSEFWGMDIFDLRHILVGSAAMTSHLTHHAV